MVQKGSDLYKGIKGLFKGRGMDGFKLVSKHRKSIMGIAGIFILIFHCWDLRFADIAVLGGIENYIKTNGFYGVDIFFFLSGFGLYFSMDQRKLHEYYIHRIVRLFPPFIIAALVYTLLMSKDLVFFLKAITGIGFYTDNIFFFLWYVVGIISISLIFPLYYFLMKKYDNDVMFTLIALAVWFIISMALRNGSRTDFYGFTNRIPIFMLGVLSAGMSQRKTFSFDWKTWTAIISVFVVGIYCVDLYMNKGVEFILPMSGCFIPPVLMMVPFVFLFAALCEKCQNGSFIPGFFKGFDKVLSFIGGITLELYCVQEMLVHKLRSGLLSGVGTLTGNIISILAAVLAAFILSLILNCYKYFCKDNKRK